MADINTHQKLSIIIPTINEAARLPLLLADLNLYSSEFELIVIDGGSLDATKFIAKLGGADVIEYDKANRGFQLNKGAAKASGDWLLFLHADSRLDKNWHSTIYKIIHTKDNNKYAWFFNFKVKDKGLLWRALELCVYLRSNLLQRPYGDQGLLISKDLYFNIGGYKEIHIMEDLDLIIRLTKTTRIKCLGINLLTSTRKITRGKIIKNAIKNASLRLKWYQGIDDKELAKKYYS